MQPPPTQYVERDGVSIAYQVVGDGPVDLLMSPGNVSHLDLHWTQPGIARFLARLATFARLIIYDKPGTGLSDPVGHLPTLEERVADMEAVLDAAGSQQAALFGISEGGPTSVLMAATHPERIISLTLFGTFAVWPTAAPEDFSAETLERAELHGLLDAVAHWGDADKFMGVVAPSVSMTEAEKRTFGIYARAAASPRMARALIETWVKIDIRAVLPSLSVPTLVLHVDGDLVVPLEASQKLAEGIPGARFVRFPGGDHAFYLVDGLVDEIERFVTGAVKRAEQNRVLASVVFTDIAQLDHACGRAGRPCLARGARAPRRDRRPNRLRAWRPGRQAHR